ncbi:MAG: anti-sigma factor family protein [Gemmatimonadaceae bacterium]
MIDHTPIGDMLRDAVPRHKAPAELRRWAEEQARAMGGESAGAGTDAEAQAEARAATRAETTPRPNAVRRWPWRPLGMAAGLLLAAALGWGGRGLATQSAGSGQGETQLASELVDSHVRSLMLDHLVDVRSSDHHTVKPWFLGKAELAPKVPELSEVGFPLIGGRMDFVGGHATPVIIYQRRKHFISLYLMQAPAAGSDSSSAPALTSERGFNVLSWSSSGVAYRAVSDVAPADLQEFREVYSAAP